MQPKKNSCCFLVSPGSPKCVHSHLLPSSHPPGTMQDSSQPCQIEPVYNMSPLLPASLQDVACQRLASEVEPRNAGRQLASGQPGCTTEAMQQSPCSWHPPALVQFRPVCFQKAVGWQPLSIASLGNTPVQARKAGIQQREAIWEQAAACRTPDAAPALLGCLSRSSKKGFVA